MSNQNLKEVFCKICGKKARPHKHTTYKEESEVVKQRADNQRASTAKTIEELEAMVAKMNQERHRIRRSRGVGL